jgi:tetratricopeptide (TPR) repeat protein
MWAPRAGVPEGPLLYNSGHLHHLVAAELDGDGRSELVAVGLNNPIGYQGVLVLLRPHREWQRSHDFGHSPDLTARWAPYEIVRESPMIAYTPFGQATSGAQVRQAGSSGISVVSGGVELGFDRAGNPLSSPLAGRGAEARQRFWVDLGGACRALESGGASGVVIGPLEATHREALSEPPMRLAAELLLARALARGGRHEEAASRLRDAVGRSPEDVDLWLRLGEQLALAGHPAEAVEALDRMAPLEGRGRGPVDYTTVKAFVGSWTGEARWLEEAKVRWAPGDADPANAVFGGSLDALWAFCRGRWDDPSFSANSVEAPSAPWAQVLAPWAELERGREPRASVAIAERLQDNAEIRELAMLLRAAALLRLGETGTASELCRQALAGFERKGRVSVEAHVWTALAQRVAGDAALAAGDRIAAERHFRAAARIAPACWFGRIR